MLALADSKTSMCDEMAVPGEVRFGATSQRDYDDAKCEMCHEEIGPNNGLLLFCDFCNKGYHLECHDPPLESAPEMADHSRGWKAHTLHEHRDEDTLGQVVEEFDRDGFVIISGLLGPELVEARLVGSSA